MAMAKGSPSSGRNFNGWVVSLALVLILLAAVLSAKVELSPLTIRFTEPDPLSKFLQSALIDIVAAILIAWVVNAAVERSYKKKLETIEKAMLDTSAVNAARVVFGTFYGASTIEEVLKSIFSSTLVRERYSIEYKFERHESSKNLLRLTFIVEFDMRNVSPVKALMPVKLMMPNLMAQFPNDPCREPPEIRGIAINGTPFTEQEIANLNAQIDPNTVHVNVFAAEVTIPPAEKVSVRAEVCVIKTIHDNEVMRTTYPTDNLSIEIMNEYGPELKIDINSIHRNQFAAKDYTNKSKSRWTWRIEGALLPNNGWIIHWNDTSRNPSGTL